MQDTATDPSQQRVTDPSQLRVTDPSQLTVTELCRILMKHGVELPVARQKKKFYIDLFNGLEKENKKRSASQRFQDSPFVKNNVFQSPIKSDSGIPNKSDSLQSGIPSKSESRVMDKSESLQPRVLKMEKLQLTPGIPKKMDKISFVDSPVKKLSFADSPLKSAFAPSDQTSEISAELVSAFQSPPKVDFSISKDPPVFESTSSVKIKSRRSKKAVEDGTFIKSENKSFEEATKKPIFPERKIKIPSKHISRPTYPWYALGALLFALIAIYFSNQKGKWPKMYCNEPGCAPCPEYAVCSDKVVLKCAPEYVLTPSYLSYIIPLKYLPFPMGQPTCKFDNAKLIRKAKQQQQVDHLLKHLDLIIRKWVGDVECGMPTEGMDWVWQKHNNKVLGMPQALARSKLKEFIGSAWSIEKFDEYWLLILDRITSGTLISSLVDERTHTRRLLVSENPAIYSASCKIRKSIWNLFRDYSVFILSLGLLLGSSLVGYNFYLIRIREKKIVISLIDSVLDAIHSETELYHMDPVRHPIPGLSVSQLCDHFLPQRLMEGKQSDWSSQPDNQGRLVYFVSDDSLRTRIWKQVQNQILKNSNIRQTVLNIKGESHTVWMWIGSAALSPVKKQKTFDLNRGYSSEPKEEEGELYPKIKQS